MKRVSHLPSILSLPFLFRILRTFFLSCKSSKESGRINPQIMRNHYHYLKSCLQIAQGDEVVFLETLKCMNLDATNKDAQQPFALFYCFAILFYHFCNRALAVLPFPTLVTHSFAQMVQSCSWWDKAWFFCINPPTAEAGIACARR